MVGDTSGKPSNVCTIDSKFTLSWASYINKVRRNKSHRMGASKVEFTVDVERALFGLFDHEFR